jgi:hypothetical protein
MGGLGSQRLSLSLCRDPAKGNFFLGVLAVYIFENVTIQHLPKPKW